MTAKKNRSKLFGSPGSPKGILLALFLILGMASLSPAEMWASSNAGMSFVGKSLTEALRELQSLGLQIVFTTNVVRPGMRVEVEPRATDPRQILDELLAPHRLRAREGPGEAIVVVPIAAEPGEGRSSISGFVLSRRNMTALAGVTIHVLESDIEVSSAGDGSFLVQNPGVGIFTVEARQRGFVVERLEGVAVVEGETTEISILLDPGPITEEELVVTPSRVSLLRDQPLAPFALGRDEILALPHLGNDFFRALTLLPGMTSNDVSAQFHVRGGRRDETQILLDGQELYEAYHLKDFDSALSVIVPETVSNVDLTTGGFSAEHGDRMSSVLDMTTVTPTGKPRFRFGASIFSLHAGAAGAFHDQRGSWLAEARRGTTDFLDRLVGEEDPQYWDAFGKLDYQLDPRNSLRLNLLHTEDGFELTEVRVDESKRIETDYASSYVWLTHQTILGSDLYFETAASVSQIDRDRRGVELEPDVEFVIRDLRELEVLGLRQNWNLQLGPTNYLKWGFELRGFDTEYDYLSSTIFEDPLAQIREGSSSDSTVFLQEFEEEHNSVYVADRLRIGKPLTMEIGLRFDQHSQTDESHLSPRLNVAYALGRASVFRIAWGRFNQSQRPYELQVEDGETQFHPVERSEHRVIGFEHLFETAPNRPDLALRVELYRREVSNPRPRYENLFEPLNNFPEVEPDRVRIAPDRSVAKGVEIFLRSSLGQKLGWWVNYAYASTEDKISGNWIPRQFDQTHSFNLDLDYRINTNWRLNMAWRYHTGWPTTPVSLQEVEDEEGQIKFEPVLGPLFSERLRDYHRLDLRASRQWRTSWGGLLLFLDIQNVYNRKNLAGFDIEIDEDSGILIINEEEWAGILPSLGFSIEF